MSGFKDLFSKQSGAYAKYRPNYPNEIFSFAASLPETHVTRENREAWDCATGNGQAALGLVNHFARIVATDASLEQIKKATPHPKIEYRVATAESSGLPDTSVDLVNVAQALHWFKHDEFFAEVKRVLRPGGAFLAFGYEFQRVTADVDPVMDRFQALVDSYWAPERKYVQSKLRTIPFPLRELQSPEFQMVKHWTLAEFAGYVGTWSATQAYVEKNGPGALEELGRELSKVWGDPTASKTVVFDFFSRAGRV